MSRSTNRFNPASTRARADAEAKEEHRFPRFLRRAGRQADRPRGRRRNGRRRDRALVAFLSFGIVAALAFLIGGYFYNRNDHDWTAVASVNGRDISRESLRGRMAVLAFLAGERARRAASATSPSSGSGEVGFVTKGQLTKAVDDAVFSQKVTMGDVIGPIDTPQGPQLFLIETVYSGMLDDRAQVAISEVRAAADIDPVALTTRFSPADVALAQDAGWRAKAEFDSSEAAAEALFVAAPGVVSDPFVLDGKLVMAIVDQRQSAKPDASMTDRLTLDGYSAWLSSEIEKAKISRNLHPLPELESAAPSTNLSASPASTPGESSLGPATQQLPTAAPVKTDQLGLPALP